MKKLKLASELTSKESNSQKMYFCLKYFELDNFDKPFINSNKEEIQKTLLRMKELSTKTVKEIIQNNEIILEQARSCKEFAISKIGTKHFDEIFKSKVYDFFRGNTALRVFGVLDSSINCFYLLRLDVNHSSR